MVKKAKKDFFISYNKADRDWAEWIAWTLEEAKYTTVLQAWDFTPGSNFILEMDRAAKEAERTIAVLSPDYFTSEFTPSEWAAAFAKDPKGTRRQLVPVRVREVEIEGLLGQIVYIDLVGRSENEAKGALLAGVKKGRRKPDTPPVFPGLPRAVAEKPRFPGGLPAIWNVPHPRNPNFTGREELLEALRNQLASDGSAAVTQAVVGLGGVGKTQLALEYAYRHASDFDLVWWLRAKESATLASDYAGLAEPLCLPERELAYQGVIIAVVRGWLSRSGGWLLIFDNAAKPDEVQPYLPQGGGGQIIITSRDPAWRGLAEPLPVEVMKPEEAVSLLLRRSGQTDKAAAAELAEELGYLPLALAQAGAYVEETGRSLVDYLELFRQRQKELLKLGAPASGYEFTVATTWELSFYKVAEESESAADLLRLCAFLAPDEIPLDLIKAQVKKLPSALAQAAADDLAWDRALAALRRYSLVEVSDRNLSIHRLVQAVVRGNLGEAERKRWAGMAVDTLHAAFPAFSYDVRNWAECSRLLAHELAATEWAEEFGVFPQVTASQLHQIGMYLWSRAQLKEAASHMDRALKIKEAIYGLDHPEVARTIGNLGLIYKDMGDLNRAKDCLKRDLCIFMAAYGPDDPEVARTLGNLGLVYLELNDFIQAGEFLERSMKIKESIFGPEHPELASPVEGQGLVYRALGEFGRAKTYLKRAQKINEETFGPDHPKVAKTLGNLGLVYQDLGDLDRAKACQERALMIEEAAYGLNHPEVAKSLINLGIANWALGELDRAKECNQRALDIYIQFLGEDHPRTQTARHNLELVEAALARKK